MTLRTEEDTVIWRRKLWIAICGGIILEECLNLSSDGLLDDDDDEDFTCVLFDSQSGYFPQQR